MRLASAALAVALGLASFLVVAAAIAALRPGPSGFVVTDKLRHLRRHPGTYDALLIGSSLTYRHFVPTVIDAALAGHGRSLRTFNVGGPGMRGHETDHVLREALAAAGGGVRFVFVEPTLFTPELVEENRRSERTVHWHTPRQTWAVVQQALADDRPFTARLALAAEHLRLCAWNQTSYGDGPRIVRHLTGMAPPPELAEAELLAARGYRALEDETSEDAAARRRALLDDPAAYHARVARRRGPAAGKPADVHDRERLRAQVDVIRHAGAEPLYVTSPWPGGSGAFQALVADGTIPALLAFDDADRYPALFRLDARFDANHLDRAAAREFSRLFADALAAWLAARDMQGD